MFLKVILYVTKTYVINHGNLDIQPYLRHNGVWYSNLQNLQDGEEQNLLSQNDSLFKRIKNYLVKLFHNNIIVVFNEHIMY